MVDGIDDLRLAIVIAPGLKESFLAEVKQLPRQVRGLLPKDLFDPSSLDTDDQLWARIPATAEAFSVIRDMEEFSVEVCEVSHLTNIPAPNLLITACQLSGIDDGLRKTGSLGWVKLPGAADNRPEASGSIFLLPSRDFLTMIKPLQPPGKENQAASNSKSHPVLMNSSSGFAASSESYGAFAFAADKKSLSAAVEFDHDIRQNLIPFEDYGEDLDAYLVVTPQGVKKSRWQRKISRSVAE